MSKKRCPGGGQVQVLDWLPMNDGYPGACVCLECSRGILVRKGSVFPFMHEGNEYFGGTLRVHDKPKDR